MLRRWRRRGQRATWRVRGKPPTRARAERPRVRVMDTTAPHIRTPVPGYIKLALLPPVLFVGRFCLVVIGFMTWSVPIFELGELVWDTGASLTFIGLPIAMCALRSRRA